MSDQPTTPDICSVDLSFSSFVERFDRMRKEMAEDPNTSFLPRLDQLPPKYQVTKKGVSPIDGMPLPPELHFGIGVAFKQILDYTSRLNYSVPAASTHASRIFFASAQVALHLSQLTGLKIVSQVANGGPFYYLYSLYSNYNEWKKPAEELEQKALDIIRRELRTDERGLWYYAPM